MKFKHRTTIFIILIVILLISSAFSVLHLRTFKENDFEEMGMQITSQTAAVFELWISDQVRLSKQIASNEAVIELCLDPSNQSKQDKATKYLTELQELYPYYENLPIAIKTDSPIPIKVGNQIIQVDNGEFLIDTAAQSTVGKAGDEYTYISEIFNGKSYYVSEIYHSITRGNPIFVISAPIVHDGVIIGVSIISPKMNYITELFVDSISIGDSGYMFVIDDSNETIAHRDRDFILNSTHETKEIIQYITNQIDNGNNFFEAHLYKSNKYYLGRKLNLPSENLENDIYIVITQDKTDVFKRVYLYAMFSILVVLFMTILLYKSLVLINKNHFQQERERRLISDKHNLEIKVLERTATLEDMSKRDGMTGLLNHKYINEYLKNQILLNNGSKFLCVAILDIDNFKNVNDTFGHQTGDLVIITLANIIQSNVRENDIVGRYGGEEFLVILNDIDFSKSTKTMNRIREEIENYQFLDIDYPITVSIGLTEYKDDDPESIIKRADTLMYQAKDSGKNKVVTD